MVSKVFEQKKKKLVYVSKDKGVISFALQKNDWIAKKEGDILAVYLISVKPGIKFYFLFALNCSVFNFIQIFSYKNRKTSKWN